MSEMDGLGIFYNAHGEPITHDAWMVLKFGVEGYHIVGQTEVGDAWVSTVWLGMSAGPEEPPLIFETMIFGGEWDLTTFRYPTLESATNGHATVVRHLVARSN